MVASVKMPADHGVIPYSFQLVDDFHGLNASNWNKIDADDASAVTHDADGIGGIVSVSAGNVDNDEAYLYSNEIIKFAPDKPLVLDCRLSFQEANANAANVMFGLMSGIAANALVDNGAGPKAAFDGAVFYKTDGTTRWRVRTSNDTANQTDETEYTAGKLGFQSLRIEFVPISAAEAKVYFWIDPNGGANFFQCRQHAVNPRLPLIQHTIQLSGLEEMAIVLGVKAGSANAETVLVDYVQLTAAR